MSSQGLGMFPLNPAKFSLILVKKVTLNWNGFHIFVLGQIHKLEKGL
jgi:hypothetical protein